MPLVCGLLVLVRVCSIGPRNTRPRSPSTIRHLDEQGSDDRFRRRQRNAPNSVWLHVERRSASERGYSLLAPFAGPPKRFVFTPLGDRKLAAARACWRPPVPAWDKPDLSKVDRDLVGTTVVMPAADSPHDVPNARDTGRRVRLTLMKRTHRHGMSVQRGIHAVAPLPCSLEVLVQFQPQAEESASQD